jgi:hypothetical protein
VVRDKLEAERIMSSTEMREIIVVNMLADYDPSEGARAAIEATKNHEGLKTMTATMSMVPQDARAWYIMGSQVYRSKFAACQQCVAAVFYKFASDPLWTSPIQLVHVPGHHFVLFGSVKKNGDWDKCYIVDLWVQNLHRPKKEGSKKWGHESSGWTLQVLDWDGNDAGWYQNKSSQIAVDLYWDPTS